MSVDPMSLGIEKLMVSATAFYRSVEALRDRSADRESMTATEFRALARLVEFGPKAPKQLARLMAVSTATVTAVIDRLESRGMVRRLPNESDGRSVILTPTDEGQEVITRTFSTYRQLYVTSLDDFPEAKVDELRAMLDLVTAEFVAANLRPDEPRSSEPAQLSIFGRTAE